MITETRNDMEQAARKKVAQILLPHVAGGLDLYSQVKHAQRNVRGPHFISIREFLDKIAEKIEDHTDEVAERAVQLGISVPGTIRATVDQSSLTPYPLMEFGDLFDHLAAVSKRCDKFLWMAEAHLDQRTATSPKAHRKSM